MKSNKSNGTRLATGLKLSMTMQVLVVATFAGMVTPTAAADDSCSDDSRGAGWEYMDCTFSCKKDQTVWVSVSQEDDDYVSGNASCQGANAACTSNVGQCDDRSSWQASSSGSGDCSGKAYSNWATDAHLICYSGDGDADEDLLGTLVGFLPGRLPGGGGGGGGGEGGGGCDDLPLNLPEGNWRAVSMTPSRGTMFSWDFCFEFIPMVTHTDDGFLHMTM